jgi:hypothetical protein
MLPTAVTIAAAVLGQIPLIIEVRWLVPLLLLLVRDTDPAVEIAEGIITPAKCFTS